MAQAGGVAFGVRLSGPMGEVELMEAVADSLVQVGIEARAVVVYSPVRIGNAVIGAMVALKPIPNSNP